MQFSEEEMRQIVSYIPYSERIVNNYDTSNEEEIWHNGTIRCCF